MRTCCYLTKDRDWGCLKICSYLIKTSPTKKKKKIKKCRRSQISVSTNKKIISSEGEGTKKERYTTTPFQVFKKRLLCIYLKWNIFFSLFMSHSLTLFLLFILRKFIFFRTPLARSTRCLMLFAKDDEKERKKKKV